MIFFFKQKTAYEMRISDWSSDVCSSDLAVGKAEPDFDAALILFQRQQLGAPFGAEVECRIEMLAQHALGFVLIVDHDERKSPRQGREVQNRLRFGILEIEGEAVALDARVEIRSEEHTSELQSLMRISYA